MVITLNRVVKAGFTGQVCLSKNLREMESQVDMCGKSTVGRGNSRCRGPKEVHPARLRKSKQVQLDREDKGESIRMRSQRGHRDGADHERLFLALSYLDVPPRSVFLSF